MIEAFREFSKWLDTTAVNPASNKWWTKFFGAKPQRKPINRKDAKALSKRFLDEVTDLDKALMQAEKINRTETMSGETEHLSRANMDVKVGVSSTQVGAAIGETNRNNDKKQIEDTYTYEKEAYLHRKIQHYRQLILDMTRLSNSDAFLFLDDLYHIRRVDQAKVITSSARG
jgi:hypothetical protein